MLNFQKNSSLFKNSYIVVHLYTNVTSITINFTCVNKKIKNFLIINKKLCFISVIIM